MKLLFSALAKFLCGLLLVDLLVFLPAGSFAFPGGWRLIGLLFVPMLLLGTVLYFKAPDLLKKRLSAKEKEKAQRGVVALSALIFPLGFVVAGLDFRFGWSRLPLWLVIAASVIFLVSYALYAEVMRENAYLSRTVEVQKGQKVIDTGLYAIVRHPMYAVTIPLFLSIPLILGSFWAIVCFLPYVGILVIRIRNEEAVLTRSLNGYAAYCKKVRYRLIPLIW